VKLWDGVFLAVAGLGFLVNDGIFCTKVNSGANTKAVSGAGRLKHLSYASLSAAILGVLLAVLSVILLIISLLILLQGIINLVMWVVALILFRGVLIAAAIAVDAMKYG
jgi:hypothetical protein